MAQVSKGLRVLTTAIEEGTREEDLVTFTLFTPPLPAHLRKKESHLWPGDAREQPTEDGLGYAVQMFKQRVSYSARGL